MNDHLPAVVGELVAEMRETVRGFGGKWISDKDVLAWADRLSALTAEAGKVNELSGNSGQLPEAGKGELPELPTPFGPWHSTSDDTGYYTYTADQMREYARLALSTATPAGECALSPDSNVWTSLDIILASAQVIKAEKPLIAADIIGHIQQIVKELEPLAASPRGASAGESA